MPRFDLQLDEDTLQALRRLALADDRSAAATLRHMVRKEAMTRGLWTPSRPTAVPRKDAVAKP